MMGFLKKHTDNIPFIALSASLVSLVLVISATGNTLSYDEAIVTEISTLPIQKLLYVTQAEPHPPGLYLLLKALPNITYKNLRLIIVALSHFLMLGTFYYAYITDLLKQKNLTYGAVLLICSPLWLAIAISIKQDAITLPMLLLSLFAFANYWEKGKPRDLILLSVLVLLALMFGYINAIKILVLFVLAVIFRPTKANATLLLVITVIISLYAIVFGFTQLTSNLNRFNWYSEQNISFVDFFYIAVGGVFKGRSFFYLADIFFSISVFLFVHFLSIKQKVLEQRVTLWVFFALFVFYFVFVGVSRGRYVSEMIVFYFFIVGWSFHYFLKNFSLFFQKLSILVLCCYFLNNIAGLYFSHRSNDNLFKFFTAIDSQANFVKTGVLGSHPTVVPIVKLAYLKDSTTFIPFNPFYNYVEQKEITKELLLADGNFRDVNENTIRKRLRESNLTRFVYFHEFQQPLSLLSSDTYYDPEYSALTALNSYCSSSKTEIKGHLLLITFENCGDV